MNNSTQLYNFNFKCSNLVNSLSVNIFCKPLLNQNTIILEKGNNSLNSYKLSNIRNTFRNNFVTVDNNYSSPASEPQRLVRNDGDLPPDKHNPRYFATLRQPSSLPNFNFNKYSSNILSCHQIKNTFSNSITSNPSINVITVLPKLWRKKPANSYKLIIYDDVNEDLYVFKSFGKSMKRSSHFIPRPRSDLILWNQSVDEPELLRDLLIGMMSMPLSAKKISISSKIIGILSVREDFRT